LDEVEELHRLSGRAVAAMMAEAPGLEVRLTRSCSLCLTGEAVADLNMAFIGPGEDAEGFLTEAVARVDARELPLLVVLAPRVAGRLAPVAEGLGLSSAGTMPLMVLRSASAIRVGRSCQIQPARTPRRSGRRATWWRQRLSCLAKL
jgi:hypothetical protein